MIAFWLDFRGLGPPGGLKNRENNLVWMTFFGGAHKSFPLDPPRRIKTEKNTKKPFKTEPTKTTKIVPISGSKKRGRRHRARLWPLGKTSHSEKSIAKPQVKHTFGNLAKTRAVRKEELFRSLVSQGRPDSLRHSCKFKVLRSDSAKLIAKL